MEPPRTEEPSAEERPPHPVIEEVTISEEIATPPVLSGKRFVRRGFARWLIMGGIRYSYRRWTRIAVRLFPEDSRRAALANAIGIPLPDQLNLSWITPHLAVGGRILDQDVPRLARVGVTHVIDTRSEHRDDEALLAAEGITLLYLPTPDTYPLTVEQLREGAAWANAAIARGQRVLIHCEHGVGRSVLLAAAVLVAAGMGAETAMRLVQQKRWQASPNHRQMRRLQEFERTVHAR